MPEFADGFHLLVVAQIVYLHKIVTLFRRKAFDKLVKRQTNRSRRQSRSVKQSFNVRIAVYVQFFATERRRKVRTSKISILIFKILYAAFIN